MRRVAALGFAAGIFFALGLGALGQSCVLSPNGDGKAPVISVNGQQGPVTVPTVQRQVSAALDATQNSGSISWIFPTAFTNSPTCWPSLSQTNTNYSFDYPTTISISKTSVTVQVVAHLNTLQIASVATVPINLPLAVSPPAGTTITLSCVGALP